MTVLSKRADRLKYIRGILINFAVYVTLLLTVETRIEIAGTVIYIQLLLSTCVTIGLTYVLRTARDNPSSGIVCCPF